MNDSLHPDHPGMAPAQLLDWLVRQALPIWSTTGVDLEGGFYEKIDLQGHPIEEARRTRVVARQVYVFATAARRGWLPGGHALADHGLDFMLRRLKQPDGSYASAVTRAGQVVDTRFDLYEQAFALFALAAAWRDRPQRHDLHAEALALLAMLRARFGHPTTGFEEAAPRSLPLRANPHMHLFEAALAWEAITAGKERRVWSELSDELAELCLAHLIDPVSGALREHFDGDWRAHGAHEGQVVEPGHQFEWAWLLMRWSALRGDERAGHAGARLLAIGEEHGVDPARGIAVNALDTGLQVLDPAAKLWPQTERIKAWHQAGAQVAGADVRLLAAVTGLSRYFLREPAGLWQEQMNADGSFLPQACRASSLYHIVCAIDTLQDAAVARMAA